MLLCCAQADCTVHTVDDVWFVELVVMLALPVPQMAAAVQEHLVAVREHLQKAVGT